MGINGLEKTEGDPDVDGDYVQVLLDPAVEQWSENCPRSEDHDFERMCVLGGKTEGCGILVVELVNMFVKQGCVEELMSCGNRNGEGCVREGRGTANDEQRTEIVEHVLEEKEECKLREHGLPRREGHLPSAHAKRLSDGVEEEDLWGTGVTQSTSRSTKMNNMGCLRLAPQR